MNEDANGDAATAVCGEIGRVHEHPSSPQQNIQKGGVPGVAKEALLSWIAALFDLQTIVRGVPGGQSKRSRVSKRDVASHGLMLNTTQVLHPSNHILLFKDDRTFFKGQIEDFLESVMNKCFPGPTESQIEEKAWIESYTF